VKTVAVIGAGGTGRGIAYLAALHGFNTILEDVSSVRLARAMEWITQSLAQAVAERQIEGAARAAAVANFSIAGVVEDAIRAADLIIETLPEEMEMKLELFTILDKFARPGAILARPLHRYAFRRSSRGCKIRSAGDRSANLFRDAC
jgi:3-hydroxyacyl-CoA dehydrogenase